ncbi:MAG: sigma-70 family RNA polymerase sigma factor [Candidatus Aminicenantes bacterium]|nr:sigma-70 family RNA polymerase sigma factor [Candidatus Aminicenantes bacterium]
MNREQELELISRARKGEVEAFMSLARIYEKPIFRLIYRLTGNREDAADLTQETLLKAYIGLKKFRGRSSFHTWLHRIAVNETLNFIKKSGQEKGRLEYLDELKADEAGLATIASPEESSMEKEFKTKLEQVLNELPMTDRLTFSLAVFQGLSHAEAAEVLGCSEGTVSWRIHEVRQAIREKLKPYSGELREV